MNNSSACRGPAPPRRLLLVVAAGVAAFAAVAVFFHSHEAPWTLRGDNKAVFYPMTLSACRTWAGGHTPEWSNGLWAGLPLLSDPSSGSLYWPTFAFFLLTPEPHLRAFDLSTAFHAGLLVAGTTRLLLMLGVSSTVAVFGAVVTVLAPLIQYWAAAWLPVYASLSWWPWLFAAAEALAQSAGRQVYPHLALGWFAFAMGAVPFPEYGLYSGVVALCWILTRTGNLGFWQRFWRAICLCTGGLALAAPQIIPSALYQAETFRSTPISTYLAGLVSLNADVRSLMLPWQAAGLAEFLFVGPTVLLLTAFAIARRRPRALFLGLVGLAALLIAVGNRTPVYGVVHELPILNLLRNPFKLGPMVEISIAWSAALGADTLWRHGQRLAITLAAVLMAIVVGERLVYGGVRVSGTYLPDSRATGFSALHQRLIHSGLLTYAIPQGEFPPPRILETVELHNLPMVYGIEALTGGGWRWLPPNTSRLCGRASTAPCPERGTAQRAQNWICTVCTSC